MSRTRRRARLARREQIAVPLRRPAIEPPVAPEPDTVETMVPDAALPVVVVDAPDAALPVDAVRAVAHPAPADPARRLVHLDERLAAAPDDAALLAERVALHCDAGALDEAERDARQLLRVAPQSATTHWLHGRVLRARGRAPEAAEALGRAVAGGIAELDVLEQLGEMQNQAGQLEAARETLERVVAEAPARAKARLLLGRVLDRLGRSHDAMEHYRQARALGRP